MDTGWIDRSDLLESGKSYVYRVRDSGQVIIYVGMTHGEPGGRFSSHKTTADWWDLAATVEVFETTRETAPKLERSEIHRWHPAHNKQCALCTHENPKYPYPPIHSTWSRLMSWHRDRLYQPWHTYGTFSEDIADLLGERPASAVFRLINPAGDYEPGNIRWGSPGGPARTHHAAQVDTIVSISKQYRHHKH